MRRYLRWFRHGHWSSTGTCFDIGGTIREALYRFEKTAEPFSGTADEYSAGNGCIMRLAPVPIYYSQDESEAVRLAGESSRTTHSATACVDACRFLACLMIGALNGESKEDILQPARWRHGALTASIDAIRLGSYRDKAPPEIRGTGYVVACLEAALWAFSTTTSFGEGALKAVNLGNDADTTGAVYGQIAGAFYGEPGIPAEWLSRLWRGGDIGALAERLAH